MSAAETFERAREALDHDVPDPTCIYLRCGHIITIDGSKISLGDGKTTEPLHECCVKAIAGL